MDIRLKTADFEIYGKKYRICCNMNVLADAQEALGGNLDAALQKGVSVKLLLVFLAAMLNDAAEEAGASERYNAKGLGRNLSPMELPRIRDTIMPLLLDAIGADDAAKNVTTTQS